MEDVTMATVEDAPKPLREIPIKGPCTGSVVFSPDGREIIRVSVPDNKATRLRIADGRSVGPWSTTASSAAVSGDGKWIICGRLDGTLTIWNAKNHQKALETVIFPGGGISALGVSPDSSKVACASFDGSVTLWSITGQPISAPSKLDKPSRSSIDWISAIQFSPAGDRLAACFDAQDGAVYIWDVSGSQPDQPMIEVPIPCASKLFWSNDGQQVFVGSWGSLIAVTASTGQKNPILIPSLYHLSSTEKFVIGGKDPTVGECVGFWDFNTSKQIGKTLPHHSPLAISMDSSLLVTIKSRSTTMFVWSLRDLIPTYYTISSVSSFLDDSVSALTLSAIPFTSLQSYSQLLNVCAEVLPAWHEDDLIEAENLLSDDGTPHPETFAYRAIVRARLGKLDEALQDAQIARQRAPNLIARLAKTVVLCRREDFEDAVVEISEICDSDDTDILLIKFIVMFEGGQHGEALDSVSKQPSLASDKQAYKFVEAYMYLLLGKDAMKKGRHAEALQYLNRAHELAPFCKAPMLDTIQLLFGWRYDTFSFTIDQQKCEAFFAASCIKEATHLLGTMAENFEDEMTSNKEAVAGVTGFKQRCTKAFENLGDRAIQSKQYYDAVAQYTLAIEQSPQREGGLFVKRSEALAAIYSWEESLQDAEEAIQLDPSSPWAYERKYIALGAVKREQEAADTRDTMLSKIDQSPESPDLRHLRRKYTTLSEQQAMSAIESAINDILKKCPLVLIDVKTGRLCDVPERIRLFKADPAFKGFLASMTAELDEDNISETVKTYFLYVMFSHRWEGDEPTFQLVSKKTVPNLDREPTNDKLRRFCEMVLHAGYRWAWSDTCCIDKLTSAVLNRSITSMYMWYERSALTIVLLASVQSPSEPGNLTSSVWMTRAWTLQELLAPKVIRFYDHDWKLYLNDTHSNHKDSPLIMAELTAAIHVSAGTLVAFDPDALEVREKLRLASTRFATVEEDVAYALIGIFSSDIRPHYGEGEAALGHLLQEIVSRLGKVTVLDWTGNSSQFNSCLPDKIAVYEQLPHTLPHIPDDDMETQIVTLKQGASQEEVVQFYHQVIGLDHPRFAVRRLRLPCIGFPVKELRSYAQSTVYTLKTAALGEVQVETTDKLSPKGRFVLVHPWIHALLDHAVPTSDAHAHTGVMPPSPMNVDGSSEMDYAAALRLIVRLRQPFHALLLEQGQSHPPVYKRVAADCEIMVQLRGNTTLPTEVRVEEWEIL